MKPEEIECQAFSQWLDFQRLKFTHIANENQLSFMNKKTASIIGAKQKRMGVRKGAPDFVILTHNGTVWVEMKDPKLKLKKGSPLEGWKEGQQSRGGLKPEQKAWVEAINQVPCSQAAVCYGAIEAIKFVTSMLNVK